MLQSQTGYYNSFSTEVEIRLLISSRTKKQMSDRDFSSCPHLRSARAYNKSCKPRVVSYASAYFSTKIYVVGTQKNRLNEPPENIFKFMDRKKSQFNAKDYCAYGGL